MATKKTTTRQKQKQSQSVKVIVNLPEKKQRRKRTSKPKQREAGVVDFKAFPPQIIYPSAPLTFYQRPQEAPKSILSPPEPKPSFLEDIGQIGTEGRVEIIDLPTKVETLQDLESLVPVRTPRIPISLKELKERKPLPFREPQFPFSMAEFERTTKPPASLAEITMKTKMPVSFADIPVERPEEETFFGMSPEQVSKSEMIQSLQQPEKKPRKTKKQLAMQREDARKAMEDEYELFTGFPPLATLSDKDLKDELKKVRTQILPSLASPYVKTRGKEPRKAEVEMSRQQLITDFYESASKKNLSRETIDEIVDVSKISEQQLDKLTRKFKSAKSKYQTIIKTLGKLQAAKAVPFENQPIKFAFSEMPQAQSIVSGL